MLRTVIATFLLFAAVPLAAQEGSPADSLVQVSASGVGATLRVPSSWHVIQQDVKDSSAVFIYHIRNAVTDTASDDRTNVVVVIVRAKMPRDFKAFTDSLMSGQFDKSTVVLGDTMWSRDRRTIFWRAQRKDTPYVGYDHLSRSGGRWVHVRFVMPLGTQIPPAWTEETLREVNAMMRSIKTGGQPFFGPESRNSAAQRPPPG